MRKQTFAALASLLMLGSNIPLQAQLPPSDILNEDRTTIRLLEGMSRTIWSTGIRVP